MIKRIIRGLIQDRKKKKKKKKKKKNRDVDQEKTI